MSKFNLGASLKLTGFDLRNNRRQIFGWIITIFSVMVLYMILFPSVQDMAKMKIDAIPKGNPTAFQYGKYVRHEATI